MIIPVQFGLNCPCGFREEAFAGLSVTFDPMGKMFQDAKVDRNSKITTTAGHSFSKNNNPGLVFY
jgi:hypothetical protein